MHNRGDSSFEDVTGAADLSAASGGTGALWADLDHDGDLDLLVYGAATSMLRNDGDGTFSDVTTSWGFEGHEALRDVAFGDMDDDGDLAKTLSGRWKKLLFGMIFLSVQ